MTLTNPAPRRSLRSRFLSGFAIALLPFAALVWFFEFSNLRAPSDARANDAAARTLDSTLELRDQLGAAVASLDILGSADVAAIGCDAIIDAVESTTLGSARVYDLSGAPLCAEAPLRADILSQLPERGALAHRSAETLTLARHANEKIVALELRPSGIDLRAPVAGVSLRDSTGTYALIAGKPLGNPMRALPKPQGGTKISMVRSEADRSVMFLPVSSTDLLLAIQLDEDYATQPAWVTALSAALIPLGFLIVSLVLASDLIERLALQDVDNFRRELSQFRTDRTLPEPSENTSGSRDTHAMRQDFAQLARQLLEEESVAEARLYHSEVLQKEVFHRVSNNFQIIQSIARLIERSSPKGEGFEALRQRIQMLSASHHALHGIQEVEMRPVGEALEELGNRHAQQSQVHSVTVSCENVALSLRETYGLLHLTSEVLLRFPHAQHIEIGLTSDQLTVRADAPPKPSDQVGEQLLRSFAQELDGVPKWEGSVFTLTFPAQRTSAVG